MDQKVRERLVRVNTANILCLFYYNIMKVLDFPSNDTY